MDILHKLPNGGVEVCETFDITLPSGTGKLMIEALEASQKTGKRKKLVSTVAGMHEGITRNKTEYHAEELERSIPTWTTPTPAPVIKDHDTDSVDGVVGRVSEAYMGTDMGKKTLMFKTEIVDPEAIEKIGDGRYSTVSIHTKVGQAICSICGNDWAKEVWCEHERGNYYLRDESDPTSLAMCTWIMRGLEARELSFVTVPSDSMAGVRNAILDEEEAAIDDIHSVFGDFSLELVTKEDVLVMESLQHGSHGVVTDDPENNGPTEKEEGVAKTEDVVVDQTDAGEQSETEEATDSTAPADETLLEGSEDTLEDEEEDNTDTQSDGTDDSEGSSSDSDESGESADEEDGKKDDEEDIEVIDSSEEAEGDDEDTDTLSEVIMCLMSERDALLDENAKLKVELVVEQAISLGLVEDLERNAVLEYCDADEYLSDLISKVDARHSEKLSVSEQIMGKVASPTLIDLNGDKKANKDKKYVVSVKTEDGPHRITVNNSDEPVKVTPRL
jgi:hypothetical protein